MRKILTFFLLAATACCPCRHLSTTERDSMRVEVRSRIEWKVLPVEVAIPQEQKEQTTPADSSYLETSIAASWAFILPDGSLRHSIFNKPGVFSTSLDVPTTHHDSIVYRTLYREVVKEIAKPLTWWQKTQIKCFWIMLIALLVRLAVRKLGNHFRMI